MKSFELRTVSTVSTYNTKTIQVPVCQSCFKKLKRNRAFVKFVTWFIVIANIAVVVLGGLNLGGKNIPDIFGVLMLPFLVLSILWLFFIKLDHRSNTYSIIGTILAPIIGPSEIYAFHRHVTQHEWESMSKECQLAERRIVKLANLLSAKKQISEDEAYQFISSYLNGRERLLNSPEKYGRMTNEEILQEWTSN